MAIALFVVAAYLVVGVLATTAAVGKERKPITPGLAAMTTFLSSLIIALIVVAGIQLL